MFNGRMTTITQYDNIDCIAGCEFDGQNYLQGDIREESCYFYRCHHGQWKNTEIKVPSCKSGVRKKKSYI